MKLSKFHLLVATAASTLVATAAQAQVLLPQVELRGAGATTVGDVAVRSLNCVGNPGAGLNQYGTNSGTLSTISPGNYNPTTKLPAHDCAADEIQPNFEGKYIGTGSGAGRQMWRNFSTSNLNGTPSNINPFSGGAGNPSGWPNLQFAFSEAPASVSDINTYNSTANNATNKAGPAIQVPFFVIPIAFAYNPVYGTRIMSGNPVNMTFNVKYPASINGVTAGGLRMRRSTYCKIFNGEITNWNHPDLKADNGSRALFDPASDWGGRWSSEGAPIRLVGRADRSGGTDVFTRAMAAQCDSHVAVNKYDKASESLPYDPTSTIDITRLRSDSNYKPGVSASNVSGTVQSLGGLVYDRVTSLFCKWDELNASKQCDASLAPGGVLTNAPTPGLFLVADGASGVASAVAATANNALIQSSIPSIKLNGKLGYVGADYVSPVPGRTLHSVAAQAGNNPAGSQYLMPSALASATAFGSVLPPETTSSTGAWDPYVNGSTGDQRQLGSVDPYLPINAGTNPGIAVSRANPLHWTAVLYNPNVAVTSTLASPAAGYPVTGSAFLHTYTCFKPQAGAPDGNNAKRYGIVNYMALMFGTVTKDSTGGAVNALTFKGLAAANLGILPQSNTALPSTAWLAAMSETFLKKSTQFANGGTLGDQNLWIQDKNPVALGHVNNVQNATDPKSNPVCDITKGA